MQDTAFVRGVIGVCRQCGDEIDVQRHVVNINVFPTAAAYQVAHPCGFRENRAVPRSVHRSTIEYLEQVTYGRRETGSPVSPEEKVMAAFHAELETIQTGEDIARALSRVGQEDI